MQKKPIKISFYKKNNWELIMKEYMTTNNKKPSLCSINEDERKMTSWLNSQNNNYRNRINRSLGVTPKVTPAVTATPKVTPQVKPIIFHFKIILLLEQILVYHRVQQIQSMNQK